MNKVDPILVLLSALFLVCVAASIFVGIKSPDDSVIFTWAAGLSTGLLGMIGLRIRPSHGDPGDASTSATTTVTKSETTSEPKG